MKRYLLPTIILMSLSLFACGYDDDSQIAVISREAGSGARSVFEELVDVNVRGTNLMTQDAIISNGNGVVANTIIQNPLAIGYISYATLIDRGDDLRSLYINGVAPTIENMTSGDYPLVRPFSFVYFPENIGEIERAFIAFTQSADGLAILAEAGSIVDPSMATPFELDHFDLHAIDRQAEVGSIPFGGTTSTELTAMLLIDAFTNFLPQVDITYEAVGSSTGLRGIDDEIFTLGFISRDLTELELASGLNKITYCLDGIVVVVHPDNDIIGITTQQLRDIYLGIITDWAEIQSNQGPNIKQNINSRIILG